MCTFSTASSLPPSNCMSRLLSVGKEANRDNQKRGTWYPERWGHLGVLFPSPQGTPWRNWWGDTVGDFIFFYELLVTEYAWVFACSGNTDVWRVTCFLLKLQLSQGVGVITGVVGKQVSKLDSLWHVEGDLKFFCLGDVYANRKNAFSSFQAKFWKIILALWIAKRK